MCAFGSRQRIQCVTVALLTRPLDVAAYYHTWLCILRTSIFAERIKPLQRVRLYQVQGNAPFQHDPLIDLRANASFQYVQSTSYQAQSKCTPAKYTLGILNEYFRQVESKCAPLRRMNPVSNTALPSHLYRESLDLHPDKNSKLQTPKSRGLHKPIHA